MNIFVYNMYIYLRNLSSIGIKELSTITKRIVAKSVLDLELISICASFRNFHSAKIKSWVQLLFFTKYVENTNWNQNIFFSTSWILLNGHLSVG